MKILLIGSVIIDVIMKIDALPNQGEDALCEEVTTTVGGCAYNVARILKHFNVDHDLFAPVGTGQYSTLIEQELYSQNYPILIKDLDKDNGYCLCLVDNEGERTFITVQGVECEYKLEWLNQIDMSHYNRIYISGYQLLGNNAKIILKWLKTLLNKEIYLDFGPVIKEIDTTTLKSLLELSPIIHINKQEAINFLNKEGTYYINDSHDIVKIIKDIFSVTYNKVYITLGKDGLIMFDGNKIIQVESDEVEVIDTIGAGDSHIASIMAGQVLGFNDKKSCKIANKVATKMVQVKGPNISQEMWNEMGIK
ncbi:hypothetical protein AN640_03655 [Candidatus Epulonipiscium fishelsonii]|uniref:Uncharacterized protein n=1 Tax=Candidatus Epulonipiscium fishelsonii TaxID=77094 RepID=A0ACC8XJ77_9FIRM|nr:hypothetical protein AN640_03655 [Epulopiscium sp. SCG-D08WGA-EpuloA1]